MEIKRIMVLLDDISASKESIKYALAFASKLKDVTLVFTKIVESFEEISTAMNCNIQTVKDTILSKMMDQIYSLFENCLVKDQLSFNIAEGVLFIEVIHEVLSDNIDLLIIPEDCIGRLGFTSHTFHLLRKCPCPVWVIRKNKSEQKPRILVALDIDTNNSVKKNVNEKCILFAGLIQSLAEAEIDILHTWGFRNEELLRLKAELHLLAISHNKLEEMVDIESIKHEKWFNDLIKDNPSLSTRKTHFLKGKPNIIIEKIVQNEKIDILIMGTVGSINVSGLIISDNAENILQNTSISVLAVKPDGFVSPVKKRRKLGSNS